MEALLLAVLADVVTPSDFTRGLIQRVERAGTGTDEYEIARDRGD